jgi:hypothetical protein
MFSWSFPPIYTYPNKTLGGSDAQAVTSVHWCLLGCVVGFTGSLASSEKTDFALKGIFICEEI